MCKKIQFGASRDVPPIGSLTEKDCFSELVNSLEVTVDFKSTVTSSELANSLKQPFSVSFQFEVLSPNNVLAAHAINSRESRLQNFN